MTCGAYCFGPDRHYPQIGTISIKPDEKYMSIEIVRINIFISPKNRFNRGVPDRTLYVPEGCQIPNKYIFWTSVHDGSEAWNRYWWENGRIPNLVPGDVLQEKFLAGLKHKLTPEELRAITPESERALRPIEVYRNFLILEDTQNVLEMRQLDEVPKDPMRLLRKSNAS